MVETEVVIVDGARTAIGAFGGTLRDIRVVDMATPAIKGTLQRSRVGPEQIDEVILGHARQAGCGPNASRIASVKAGIPSEVPAYGIQQACISGMKSIMLASDSIKLGYADLVLAGGMEHHSSIPYLAIDNRWGARMGDVTLVDAMFQDGYQCGITDKLIGELMDDVATERGITRKEQDQFAVESQQKARAAKERGFFAKVIVPLEVPQRRPPPLMFQDDEHPRSDTTLESLSRLRPAFDRDGTITAGTSSGITDGACGLVVASRKKADELGLQPLGTVLSYWTSSVDAKYFGLGPVPAVKKALEMADLALEEIDLIEVNEAFAAQVIAVVRDLALDESRLNVNGGAIALGHPTGMSGARLPLELLYSLKERGGRYGLATICGNGGHGGAMIVESAR